MSQATATVVPTIGTTSRQARLGGAGKLLAAALLGAAVALAGNAGVGALRANLAADRAAGENAAIASQSRNAPIVNPYTGFAISRGTLVVNPYTGFTSSPGTPNVNPYTGFTTEIATDH